MAQTASLDSERPSFGNIDKWIEKLKQCKALTEGETLQLCGLAKEVFLREENILKLQTPITLVGDIHGQFYDLMEMFKVGGNIPDTNYLFLGDFVDRGKFGLQVVCLALALKVRYPRRVFMLRGNHESRQLTLAYGFHDECLTNYGNSQVWRALTDVFDYLPLTATINDRVFCVHGGLSPQVKTMDQIFGFHRIGPVPIDGVVTDLVWSDPQVRSAGWVDSTRGISYQFGPDVTAQFLRVNDMDYVVRAHELKMEGHEWCHDDGVLTIFSAPNYCNRCGNRGAIMLMHDDGNHDVIPFEAAVKDTKPVVTRRATDFYL